MDQSNIDYIKKHPFRVVWALIWAVPTLVFLGCFAVCVGIINLDINAVSKVWRDNQ